MNRKIELQEIRTIETRYDNNRNYAIFAHPGLIPRKKNLRVRRNTAEIRPNEKHTIVFGFGGVAIRFPPLLIRSSNIPAEISPRLTAGETNLQIMVF